MSSIQRLALAVALMLAGGLVGAQTVATQSVAKTQQSSVQEGSSTKSYSTLDQHDLLLAQIWNLSQEEMIRAKVLLEGPRKSFSVENLSPIEALGIHARSDAERRKYAEMFARALRADVERSLAWNNAFAEAMQRLYPNSPVIDYSGLAKVTAPTGAADALGVPRGLVVDPAATAVRPAITQRQGVRHK